MKRPVLFMLIALSFAGCKKFSGPLPEIHQPAALSAKADTIPDKAFFRLKLAKDSTNADETEFSFSHTATTAYSSNDAAYFPGFGQVSLASISSDGRDLAINCLPYISNRPIGLDVRTKTDGTFLFKISYESHIPAFIRIWLMDRYLKDSMDMRAGNYKFAINRSDTSSFGNKRFAVILREQ